MALVQKILKNNQKTSLKFISSLKNPNFLNPNLSPISDKLLNLQKSESVPNVPDFAFGYPLNPNLSTNPQISLMFNEFSDDFYKSVPNVSNFAFGYPKNQISQPGSQNLKKSQISSDENVVKMGKSDKIPIFPSFPYVLASGLVPEKIAGEHSGEVMGEEMWADSVKKKRKRKMNKHKLKKLRKRLRRKT